MLKNFLTDTSTKPPKLNTRLTSADGCFFGTVLIDANDQSKALSLQITDLPFYRPNNVNPQLTLRACYNFVRDSNYKGQSTNKIKDEQRPFGNCSLADMQTYQASFPKANKFLFGYELLASRNETNVNSPIKLPSDNTGDYAPYRFGEDGGAGSHLFQFCINNINFNYATFPTA